MSPILKSKERRDFVLLVGMVVLTCAFLLYLLIPASKEKTRAAARSAPGSRKGVPVQGDPPMRGEDGFSATLSRLLNQAFRDFLNPEMPGPLAATSDLERHLDHVEVMGRTKGGREALRNWRIHSRRIGLFELGDPKILNVPAFLSQHSQFHLYLALLYLKARTPEGLSQLRNASEFRLMRILDAPIFETINWELRGDEEALPLLIVFRIWIDGRDIYPQCSPGMEFSRRLSRFRDLGPGRWVSRIRRLIDFSKEIRTFTIQWTEDDGIFGTDRGVFPGLRLPVHQFLGRRYSGLPAPGEAHPDWLSRLSESDAGEIELVEFKVIGSQERGTPILPESLCYQPRSTRFLILYQSSQWERDPSDPLLNMVISRRNDHHRADHCLSLLPVEADKTKRYLEDLKDFGHFLKRLGAR